MTDQVLELNDIQQQVRDRYAETVLAVTRAEGCCADGCGCGDGCCSDASGTYGLELRLRERRLLRGRTRERGLRRIHVLARTARRVA